MLCDVCMLTHPGRRRAASRMSHFLQPPQAPLLFPTSRTHHDALLSRMAYDRAVPALRNSLIPIVGILLNRLLLLPVELDFAELGDDA